MKLGIVVLSCNQLHLTNTLMSDIRDENPDAQIIVVDNGGGYLRQYNEYIIKPPENLRWVRGVNLALLTMLENPWHFGKLDGLVCLNDDIRLSRGFFDGLVASYEATEAGLIAPVYDDVYEHQKGEYRGAAEKYVPIERDDEVKFVDGTAFFMPTETTIYAGLLDEEHFGKYGWGSDFDLSYRVRDAGSKVVVTHRSFINHFHQGSAKFVEDDWSGKAGMEMEQGMTAKYGPEWRKLIFE